MSSFPAQAELDDALTQLTTSTKKINAFVSILENNQSHVSAIIDQFGRYISTCPDNQKIPILYAIDVLFKQFASKKNPYLDGICKILVDNFDRISTVQAAEATKLNKLLDMWRNKSKHFPSGVLKQLDAKNRTKQPETGIDLNNIDFTLLGFDDGADTGKIDDNAFAHFSTGKEYDRPVPTAGQSMSSDPSVAPATSNAPAYDAYPYPTSDASTGGIPPQQAYPPYNPPQQPQFSLPPGKESEGYYGGNAAPYTSNDRDRDYYSQQNPMQYDPRTQPMPGREQYDPRNANLQQPTVSQPSYISVTSASEAYPPPVFYKSTLPPGQPRPSSQGGDRQHPLGFSIDANQQGVPPGKTRVASTVLWMGFNNNELSFQQLKEIFSRCGTPFIQIRILPKHAFVTLASRRQAVRAAVLLSGIPISVALGHSTTIGTGQSSNQPRQYGDRIKINWSKAQFFHPSTWDPDLGIDLVDTNIIEEEAFRQIMVENVADLALIDLSQCLDLRKVTLAQDLAQLLGGPPIDPALSALVGNYARNEAFKNNFELKQQQIKADSYTRKYLQLSSANSNPPPTNTGRPGQYGQPIQDQYHPPHQPYIPQQQPYMPPQDQPHYPPPQQQHPPHYPPHAPQEQPGQYLPHHQAQYQRPYPPQQTYSPQRSYPPPQQHQQPPYSAAADYKAV